MLVIISETIQERLGRNSLMLVKVSDYDVWRIGTTIYKRMT